LLYINLNGFLVSLYSFALSLLSSVFSLINEIKYKKPPQMREEVSIIAKKHCLFLNPLSAFII